MKFIDIIKKTAFIIACPALVFSSQWQITDTVCAEENTDVVISIENREIVKNEIPSDRKIDLNVSIDKNPGFSEMYIILENTSGLSFYYNEPVSGIGIYSGAENQTLDAEKNLYYSVIKASPSPKNDRENIATVSLKLPDSVNAGDTFEIKFIGAYENGEQNYTSGFMCGENLVGFKEMQNGSIRIVEAKATEPPATEPAPAETPAPEPPHTDPPQEPEHNDHNNDNNNGNDQNSSQETQAPEQTQPSQQTSVPVTTAVTGTSLSSSVTVSSAVSVPQTTPSAVTEKVTTSAAETVSDPEPGYGEEKDDVAVNSENYEFKPDRTIEYILIASIAVVAVAGFFTILSILKRYKKK